MSRFVLSEHAIHDRVVVEVWEGDEFIATIYPVPGQRDIKIVSKHRLVAKDDPTAPNLSLNGVIVGVQRDG